MNKDALKKYLEERKNLLIEMLKKYEGNHNLDHHSLMTLARIQEIDSLLQSLENGLI